MSNPWTFPYFGSWKELISSLLGRIPFPEPPPDPWLVAGPGPQPWSPAASFLISAISLNQVARQMPEGAARRDLSRSVEGAIELFVDDCGTEWPRHRHWPRLGPSPEPWITALVSELGFVAQSFQGTMREQVLQVAGQIVQKSFATDGKIGEKVAG